TLRGCDMLARLGGDEFGLLLPETSGAGAVAVLTRLQGVLAFEMARGGRPVTASIGAGTFVGPAWGVGQMVQQVDVLMYAAKRRGKDRIEHTTVRSAGNARTGEPLRFERRATARTVGQPSARVRPEGEGNRDELYATVHDLSPDGVGLRMDRRFAEG